jgi:hypothetical protein
MSSSFAQAQRIPAEFAFCAPDPAQHVQLAPNRNPHLRWTGVPSTARSLVLLCVAFVVMGFTLTPETSQLGVTLRMVLVGLGIGPTFPIYTLIVQNAARPQEIGVVTAALTFARSLGQVIGVSVLGTVFAATLTGSMARNVEVALRDVPPGARALVGRVVPVHGTAASADGLCTVCI